MRGELDPRYVVTRAVIVVGAQAVCVHTGAIDLTVPEFTVDADLRIDPALLRDNPRDRVGVARRALRPRRPASASGAWVIARDVGGVRTQVH